MVKTPLQNCGKMSVAILFYFYKDCSNKKHLKYKFSIQRYRRHSPFPLKNQNGEYYCTNKQYCAGKCDTASRIKDVSTIKRLRRAKRVNHLGSIFKHEIRERRHLWDKGQQIQLDTMHTGLNIT